MKNKKLLLILAAFLVLSLLTFNSASSPGIASVPDSSGVIRVIGESMLTASPDQCIIVLAVETIGTDARTAAAENAKSMDKVIAELKRLGLKDDQIKTGTYSLHTQLDHGYPERPKEQLPTQYRVYNSLTITLNNLEMIGQVIDKAIASGANQVQSVHFELKNNEAVKLQALQAATAQAKSKGEAIAKGAGVKITGIKSISEEGSGYSPFRAAFQKEMMMDETAGFDPPTTIIPGDVEVYARVVVEYSF
ncbi:MAG: SIMPL domain-containing protein [Clostridia bacterium]|jgi:uncharacterized protein YggE|uniref:SIMPL domain-containing protein n=1 Tax=Desulfitibacter alkalitolerans TaxID=264641 RepID=UPI000486C641|nr:SIMPL domain-containing protein [Desulfitibacter alkalitolerans]MBS3969501.1 SIMPL domain-containing protein [Clostridia bacterium]